MDMSTILPNSGRRTSPRMSEDVGPSGAYVVGGVHAGAIIRIAPDEAVLVGTSEDCEVILSDPGVATHHCLLAAKGTKVSVRPVSAPVLASGRRYSPGGETAVVDIGERIELGSAVLEIVSAADLEVGRPQMSLQSIRPRRGFRTTLLRQSRWGIAAVLAVAVACEVHPVGERSDAATPPANMASSTQAEVSADDVAHDVAEVFRLSGISADARSEGEGTVIVTGHLGEMQAVGTLVQSRAIREINGLKRVKVVNLDAPRPTQPTHEEPGDSNWIVTAVASKDPYVIANDGSRYYVGATLPRGGRLAGVQDGEILVDRDGQVTHVPLSGSRPGG